MEGLEEAADGGGVAGVFAMVLAKLASRGVEGPGFGDLHREELDDDVHWFHAGEVVGEVGANAKRWDTFPFGIPLDADGFIHVEAIAENHLFARRINAQCPIFRHNLVELLIIVAAVNSQTLEHIGIILRKVEAEDLPTVSVIEECTQRTAIGV